MTVAAVLVGSVHENVRAHLGVAAAILAATALLVNSLGARTSLSDLKPGWAFYIPAAMACVVLFQLIPLPPAVRDLVDPATSVRLGDVFQALGLSATRPIAWDKPAAVMGLLHYSSFALLVFTTIIVCRRRSRGVRFAWALDVCLLTLSVFSLVNYLSGDDRIWWLYQPAASVGNAVAPFVNENHAGGFYLAAGLFHIGLSLTIPPSRKRWAVLALGIFPVFLCFLARSRGAHLGFFPGLLIIVVSLYRNGHMEKEFALKLLAAAVVVIIGLIPSVQVVRDAYGVKGLEGISEDTKIAMWWEGMEVAREHPVTGVGSGSYRVAVATKTPPDRRGSVHHAENIIVQTAVELGLPALILFLTLAAVFLVKFARRTIWDPAACGAVGALSGLFFQNLVDFNLEFPGTAFLAAALVGFVAASGKPLSVDRKPFSKRRVKKPDESTSPSLEKSEVSKPDPAKRSRKRRSKKLGIVRLAVVSAVICTGLAAALTGIFWAAPNSLLNETHRVESALKKGRTADAHELVSAALRRHPADYYLHYLKAFILFSRREGEPLRWVNHAISLSSNDPRPHLLASRILATAGAYEQAHAELARSLERGLVPVKTVVDYLVDLTIARLDAHASQREASFHSMRSAAIASSSTGLPMITNLTMEFAETGWNTGYRLFMGDVIAGRLVPDRRIFFLVAENFLSKGRTEAAVSTFEQAARRWPEEIRRMHSVPEMLARAGRTGEALHWALRILDVSKTPRAYLAAADIYEKALDRKQAHDLLADALVLYPRDTSLILAAARNALKLGKHEAAREMLQKGLREMPDMKPKTQVQFLVVLRDLAVKRGDRGEARRLDYRIARIKILDKERSREPGADTTPSRDSQD